MFHHQTCTLINSMLLRRAGVVKKVGAQQRPLRWFSTISFYITAKVSYWESPISISFDVCNFQFGDNHSKEIEEVWATLCTSWPNNMKVIIRYLIIISGMAPCELLPYVSGESVLNCVHRNVLNITDKTSSLVSSKSTAG
jgi:hypothetical protein